VGQNYKKKDSQTTIIYIPASISSSFKLLVINLKELNMLRFPIINYESAFLPQKVLFLLTINPKP